jgi:hypothetical protein
VLCRYARDMERRRVLGQAQASHTQAELQAEALEYRELTGEQLPQGANQPNPELNAQATAEKELTNSLEQQREHNKRMAALLERQNEYIEKLKQKNTAPPPTIEKPMPRANINFEPTKLTPPKDFEYWNRVGDVVISEHRGLTPRRPPAGIPTDSKARSAGNTSGFTSSPRSKSFLESHHQNQERAAKHAADAAAGRRAANSVSFAAGHHTFPQTPLPADKKFSQSAYPSRGGENTPVRTPARDVTMEVSEKEVEEIDVGSFPNEKKHGNKTSATMVMASFFYYHS